MSVSRFFNVALIQFLTEQDGSKTISELVDKLKCELRSESDIIEENNKTKDVNDTKDTKITKKKKTKKEKVKKTKKKRVKSAFQFFMGEHRPQIKKLIAKFMEENSKVQPSVAITLLTEAAIGKELSETDDIVSLAKNRLDNLKTDGYEEWCTSNELDPSDYEGSFKGRIIMTMMSSMGGKLWHSLKDKSYWEDLSAEAKEKIAEEEANKSESEEK